MQNNTTPALYTNYAYEVRYLKCLHYKGQKTTGENIEKLRQNNSETIILIHLGPKLECAQQLYSTSSYSNPQAYIMRDLFDFRQFLQWHLQPFCSSYRATYFLAPLLTCMKLRWFQEHLIAAWTMLCIDEWFQLL